jgi:hypothetical protein
VENSVSGRQGRNAGPKAKTARKMGCYNQAGGGNSSTGRAPDCGSDGCGFDSRFPPQNFPSTTPASYSGKDGVGAPNSWTRLLGPQQARLSR